MTRVFVKEIDGEGWMGVDGKMGIDIFDKDKADSHPLRLKMKGGVPDRNDEFEIIIEVDAGQLIDLKKAIDLLLKYRRN